MESWGQFSRPEVEGREHTKILSVPWREKKCSLNVLFCPGLNSDSSKRMSPLPQFQMFLYPRKLLLPLLNFNLINNYCREELEYGKYSSLGKKIGLPDSFLIHLQAFKMEMFYFSQLWVWGEASSSSSTSSHPLLEHNGTFLSCSHTVGRYFLKMKNNQKMLLPFTLFSQLSHIY